MGCGEGVEGSSKQETGLTGRDNSVVIAGQRGVRGLNGKWK